MSERGRRLSQLAPAQDSEITVESTGEGASTDAPKLGTLKRSLSRGIAKRSASVKGVSGKAGTAATAASNVLPEGSVPQSVTQQPPMTSNDIEWLSLKDDSSSTIVRSKSSTTSLRRGNSVARSSSPTNDMSAEQYADFIALEQQQKIAKLVETKNSLMDQIAAKNKIIADLRLVERESAARAEREAQLERQLASARDANASLSESLKAARADQSEYMTARSAMVLEDAKKNIQIKTLKLELAKVNTNFKELVDKIVSESQNASNASQGDLQNMIEKLRDENKSLIIDNQNLKQENERHEQSLNQLLLQQPALPALSTSKNQPGKFPERSTSAIGLIDVLPKDGNLEIQMLRQRAMNKQQEELERLREENKFLLEQYEATLESLNKIQ
ncbi:hypothetical protein CcCBS67573_g09583 [Chytriomyces confervae]|uniref:Uncharacterized protein n=1 Tax=Chytriomyces confervae TaxID=246404 RepID=A0A507DSZ4_9FUNG|nr:hypothetical protein CcCBS67573_g09583 [Chytriomyces confervae]